MTTYYLYAFLLDKDEQEMTEIPRVFMDTHPKVTEKEIWEAAFMAGHRMATTLLTGEPT